MNSDDLFGEALENLNSIPSQMAKSATQGATSVVQTAASQITGSSTPLPSPTESGNAQTEAAYKEQNQQDLEAMFGKTDLTPQQINAQKSQKELEDKQKIEAMRKQLHGEYYQKLITPPPKPEEQERPQERVERLEDQDLQKKQKEEEKKTPIAVLRAKNSAENKSPGAG